MSRIIDRYEQRGMPERAATYRARQPVIALRDLRDLGPLKSSPAGRRWNGGISAAVNQRSAWVFGDDFDWNFRSIASWGWLEESALQEANPRIRESDASFAGADLLPLTEEESQFNAQRRTATCTADCSSRWFLSAQSMVADPSHGRSLVFYSKSLLEWTGGPQRRTGTSLAIWRSAETTAERPKVRPQGRELTLLFDADEPQWGTAALSRDGLLYAYGCDALENQLTMTCLLARVPLDRAFGRSSWRFYAGGGNWTSDWHDAQPVLRTDKVELFSVQWNEYLGKYLAVYRSIVDRWIRLRVADRPEGPWSEPVIEIQGLRRSGEWIGLALGHPEIARDGGRIEYLTYSRPTRVGDEIRVLQIEFK